MISLQSTEISFYANVIYIHLELDVRNFTSSEWNRFVVDFLAVYREIMLDYPGK